ncbi:MAG: hypothetical protein WA956_15450 [Stenotrophomonas sp.]
MGGGTVSYGTARHPGMLGKYLDVALHNRRQPGAPADQTVPKGLKLGEQIHLVAPENRSSNGGKPTDHDVSGQQQDGSYKVRYYWGCGEQLRARQPAEYTVTVRNGKPVTNGRAMTPRQVPANGINAGPQYALWPNPGARKTVGTKASLVGKHHVTGNNLPDAMRFELSPDHDFLAELKLKNEGSAEKGMALRWDGVDGAGAYFIHATAMNGDTLVMWSSSEDGYAGPELFDYLPDSLVTQWTRKRTLLDAESPAAGPELAHQRRVQIAIPVGLHPQPRRRQGQFGLHRHRQLTLHANAVRNKSMRLKPLVRDTTIKHVHPQHAVLPRVV